MLALSNPNQCQVSRLPGKSLVNIIIAMIWISSVQLLSCVWLFVTPWTEAPQVLCSPLSPTVSSNLSVGDTIYPSHPLPLPFPLLPSTFSSIRVFSNVSAIHIRCQSIGVSASTSVLPMNTQDWSPLAWTGWIHLQPKRLSRVFSNATVQKHQFFSAQHS